VTEHRNRWARTTAGWIISTGIFNRLPARDAQSSSRSLASDPGSLSGPICRDLMVGRFKTPGAVVSPDR